MSEYQAFADLLKAVGRIQEDVRLQFYGDTSADGEWEAHVCPKLMDAMLDAYQACLIAKEDAA